MSRFLGGRIASDELAFRSRYPGHQADQELTGPFVEKRLGIAIGLVERVTENYRHLGVAEECA